MNRSKKSKSTRNNRSR